MKTQTKIVLYIGANNTTGIVERDKICEIVGKYFDGFTLHDSIGYWKGKQEPSAVVTIMVEDTEGGNMDKIVTKWSDIVSMCVELRETLKQDAILLERSTVYTDFI